MVEYLENIRNNDGMKKLEEGRERKEGEENNEDEEEEVR